MAKAAPATVEAYLAALPADRREALTRVRDEIARNLPKGYAHGMQFGMPAWYVPLEAYPDTYNGKPLMLAAIASQKQYMAVYLLTVYAGGEIGDWFARAYRATGKKLDMGKSCVRFKTLADLPVELVGQVIAKVPMATYIAAAKQVRAATTKQPTKKPAAKRPARSPARRTAATAKPRGRSAPTRRSRSS